MKKITIILVAAMTLLFSCTKETTKQQDSAQMNFDQLSKAIGSEEIAFDLFYKAGKTEASPTARGRKPKANATLTVFTDLEFSYQAPVFTLSLSPAVEWAGVQRFVDQTTSDGAVSVCNYNFWWTTAPLSVICSGTQAGYWRGWCSDSVTYDVHLSAFIQL